MDKCKNCGRYMPITTEMTDMDLFRWMSNYLQSHMRMDAIMLLAALEERIMKGDQE